MTANPFNVTAEPLSGGPMETADEFFAFPLSPAQERMWRADQGRPGCPALNGSFRFSLEGAVDPKVLERSLNEIVRRHEILRATFQMRNGTLAQVIAPVLKVGLTFTDLRQFSSAEREKELDRICTAEARKSFDLANGPLARFGLLQMEELRYVLMVTIHHIVCDGWSLGLIMEELTQIYPALIESRQSPLAELPIQFADYVIWREEWDRGPRVVGQTAFWKKKLAGYKRLEVKADFPRPSQRSINSAIISNLLPRELSSQLREFSNQTGSTMFNTTLAACMTLLWRYTGQTDICLGTPLAGRNRPDIEGLIGLFINYAMLRAEVDETLTFSEFASRVRESVWETLDNQDAPFEHVVKSLHPSEDIFRDPFYTVSFICQREYARASAFTFDLAGVRMSTMPSKSQGALYDLNFFMVEREAGWRLSLEYNTDLFRSSTAERMLEDFTALLHWIAEDANRKISECPIKPVLPQVSSTTAHIVAVQEPAATGPAEPEVFAMPASVVQKRFWTLGQLDASNAALHMHPCVRISGDLSPDLLQCSLQRLVERHELLRTSFEMANDELLQVIAPSQKIAMPVISLEDISPSRKEATLRDLLKAEVSAPFDLARGPLVRARLFRVGAGEHVFVMTTHHIIVDGWSQSILQRDLWAIYEALEKGSEPSLSALPLQYGDYVHWQQEWLASPAAQEELEFWKRQLAAPLPVLEISTDHPPRNRPQSNGGIETLLLPEDLVQRLKRISQAENLTMFMLTLGCFGILLHRYTLQDDFLIGSPVAHRNPDTESLIGPFAGRVSLRMNFSGNPTVRELLHRVHETALDALGHAELPFEILLEHLDVRSVHGRNPFSQLYFFYQTAFLQPRQLPKFTVTPVTDLGFGTHFELQLAVIERQEGLRVQFEYNPDLFLPATIQKMIEDYRQVLDAVSKGPELHMDAIPVSPRKQTPTAPGPPMTKAQVQSLPPRNETEQKLTAIWEEVLATKPIGVNDNYFDLGGNSILATRLFAQVERAFGLKLPLSTLFEAQTPEAFAQLLNRRQQGLDSEWSPLVPIQKNGTKPIFFCAHGAGGNVLIYRDLSRLLGDDQPFYGLQSRGLDGMLSPCTTIEEMASLYVSEIRKVQPRGPYFLGGYCMGGTVAYEMAQQLTALGEKVALLAVFDTLDWTKVLPADSLWAQLRHQGQRVSFHIKSIFLLGFKDKLKFFQEKLKVLFKRVKVWKGMLLGRIAKGQKHHDQSSWVLANVWRANDEASLNYAPQAYPGFLTEFRPVRQYSRCNVPNIHLDHLAQKGADVVTLPLYPAGMMVQPFLQYLAEGLKQAIEKAICRN